MTGAVTGATERLVARTRRLDRAPDLLDVAGAGGALFVRGGIGLAGRGVAARIPLPGGLGDAASLIAAEAALGSIGVDDEVAAPGSGPAAFAALPFRPDAPAELVVPELIVGVAPDGSAWSTTVSDRDADPTPVGAGRAGTRHLPRSPPERGDGGTGPGPSAFEVRPGRDVDEWCDAVAAGRAAVRSGRAEKVVLAREVHVDADASIDRAAVLDRLRLGYPDCMVFAVDGFVGASPELLVARTGDLVRSHPMAGSARRGGDPATDSQLAAALLASPKERQEHQITIDAVHDVLLPYCSYLDAEAEPSVVAMANVQHIATLVHGRLSLPAPSALALAADLHPTPAVCGWPRQAALELIAELEGIDRGPYAGAVGWVDAAGNGVFAVGIRSALLDGSRARLFAGVGVVADSDPAAELAETRVKLQALLTAIVRP